MLPHPAEPAVVRYVLAGRGALLAGAFVSTERNKISARAGSLLSAKPSETVNRSSLSWFAIWTLRRGLDLRRLWAGPGRPEAPRPHSGRGLVQSAALVTSGPVAHAESLRWRPQMRRRRDG